MVNDQREGDNSSQVSVHDVKRSNSHITSACITWKGTTPFARHGGSEIKTGQFHTQLTCQDNGRWSERKGTTPVTLVYMTWRGQLPHYVSMHEVTQREKQDSYACSWLARVMVRSQREERQLQTNQCVIHEGGNSLVWKSIPVHTSGLCLFDHVNFLLVREKGDNFRQVSVNDVRG